MTTTTIRWMLPIISALMGFGSFAAPAIAGPLSDMLFGGRNDSYYPVDRPYVPANSAPATPVTSYYAPASTGNTAAPVIAAPSSTSGIIPATPAPTSNYTPTTSYYAPAANTYPSQPAATSGYGPATTVLSPPVSVAPAAPSNPVVMYRMTAPVVTQATAAAPLSVPATTSSVVPVTAYSPYTAYSANTAVAASAAHCNPCAVPAPSYRTVWYRVPVTNFRPVTSVDPCTGCPTTVMRPCTTYTWQARRVPDERPRSWLSRLFCCFPRRPDPPPVTVPPVAVTTNCAPTTYGCAPATAPASAPYYTAPAPVTSSTTVPSTTTPAYQVPPTYPGTTAPGAVPLREPADYPPRLDPGYSPPPVGIQREGSAYPPIQFNNSGLNGSNGAANENGQDENNGTEVDSSNNTQTTIRGPASLGPATGASSDLRRTPQPVPDPDAIINTQKRFEPPRLLNPRDRSASYPVQRAGAFVLISWPEREAATSASSAAIEQPSRATEKRPYDDGGWRSIAQ